MRVSLCSRRMGCAPVDYEVYRPSGAPTAQASRSHVHAFSRYARARLGAAP